MKQVITALLLVLSLIAFVSIFRQNRVATTDTVHAESSEEAVEEPVEETLADEVKTTWKDNPHSCDLNKQYVMQESEDFRCKDKPVVIQKVKTVAPTPSKNTTKSEPVKAAVSSPSPQPTITSSNYRVAMDFYIANGFTKMAAANLAGTINQESGFRTTVYGDGGKAYGIYQWHPSRRYDMPSGFHNQLVFSIKEMKRDSPNTYRVLTSSSDKSAIRSAIKSWIRWGHLGSRWHFADQYYSSY